MFIQKVLKKHWIVLIAGYLFSSINAQASVHAHPADGDVAKVRSAASALGAIYKNSVCGLTITTKSGEIATASGFLVEKPAAGVAKIVTTAHDFYDEESHKWSDVTSVRVTFSGAIDLSSPIKASRVDVKDEFLMDPTTAVCRNDVAVVEVPFDLMPATCVPLDFYAGAGYKRPLIKSSHAGYSHFGTTKTSYDHGLPKLYGGYTVVTYSNLYVNPYFITYLGSPYTTPAEMMAGPERLNHFDPALKAEIHIGEGGGRGGAAAAAVAASREGRIERGLIQIYETHEDQSLMARGGSGSPLLFSTKDGVRVAGIYSRIIALPETIRLPGGHFCLAACYEPTMGHKDWILRTDAEKPVSKRYVF